MLNQLLEATLSLEVWGQAQVYGHPRTGLEQPSRYLAFPFSARKLAHSGLKEALPSKCLTCRCSSQGGEPGCFLAVCCFIRVQSQGTLQGFIISSYRPCWRPFL